MREEATHQQQRTGWTRSVLAVGVAVGQLLVDRTSSEERHADCKAPAAAGAAEEGAVLQEDEEAVVPSYAAAEEPLMVEAVAAQHAFLHHHCDPYPSSPPSKHPKQT